MGAPGFPSAPSSAQARTPSIIAGFAVISGLLFGVAAVGLVYLTSINQQLAGVVDQQNAELELITLMRNAARERALLLSSMLTNPDPFSRDEAFMAFRDRGRAFIRARNRLAEVPLVPEEAVLLERIDEFASHSAQYQYQIIDLLNEERFAEATRILLAHTLPAQERVVAQMDAFVQLQEQQNTQVLARGGNRFRDGYLLILLLGSMALFASVAVGRKVNRRIGSAVAELEVARRQLQRSNQALEGQVQERTRALRLANASLRREVAEREQAQAALARSELRYRSFVEHFQGIAFQSDLDLRPIFVHGAVEAITGFVEADFLANRVRWEKRVHEADRKAFLRDLSNPLRHVPGFSCEGEYRLYRRDGELRFLQGFMRNVTDAAGRIQLIEGTLFDVTERKRAELALQESEGKLRAQAEQLAEADRRKDEFLALLGHELRNPLAPIRHAVETVRRGADDPATRSWACDVIDRQSRQLSRLVDDLLVIARITRGRLELRAERVELTRIIRHALNAAQPLMEQHGHSTAFRRSGQAMWVDGDSTRLEQVIINLLNNAATYSERGKHIEVEIAEADGQAVIEVRDQGFGMSPDMLERVFEPFTSGGPSGGGLGLGLTLVRQLVEMHGGDVRAHSTGPGQGCCVAVRLPLVASSLPAPLRPSRPDTTTALPYPPSALRLLVVDDNPDVAESLRLLLNALGHEVWSVADGPSALETVERLVPELVFLDLGLPGMDGYAVARQLRARSGHQPYLVALTGYGQDIDRRRSAEAGFDRHLLKPACIEDIEAALAEAVRRRSGAN